MSLRLAIAMVLLSASGIAQTRISGHMIPRPIGRIHSYRHFYPGYAYYGLPYFYTDYEPDEEYAAEPIPRPQPAPAVKAGPAPDPLLLELHGGQWVRVNEFTQASENVRSAAPPVPSSTKPLPPAVLVFRDGHTEEVSSYSIIGSTIYTKADYWRTGEWTRTIQLADVNVTATVEQNHIRGVDFALPSSPDEIMVRP